MSSVSRMLFLLFLTLMYSTSNGVYCIERDGELVLRDGDKDVSGDAFGCKKVLGRTETRKVAMLKAIVNKQAMCEIRVHSGVRQRFVLRRSDNADDDKHGYFCKYKCVGARRNSYDCTGKVKMGECTCEKKHAHVEIVGVKGIGSDALDETCLGRSEGYQFPDGVACVSIRADVRKRRTRYINRKRTVCKTERVRLGETRYMKSTKMVKNLQGCFYICKRRTPVCFQRLDGNRCKCRYKGLKKMLVGMGDGEVQSVLDQESCLESNDCGVCGVCNRRNGECMVIKGASEGNYCSCGEICPSVDERKGNKGGKIVCIANVRMGCNKHGGGTGTGTGTGTGRVYGNYCSSGSVDKRDLCSCARGYERVVEAFGGVYCRKRW